MKNKQQGPRPLRFGEALGFLRAQQRLTICELAELVGWPPARIEYLEYSDGWAITQAEAVELAKALDVDLQMLTAAMPK